MVEVARVLSLAGGHHTDLLQHRHRVRSLRSSGVIHEAQEQLQVRRHIRCHRQLYDVTIGHHHRFWHPRFPRRHQKPGMLRKVGTFFYVLKQLIKHFIFKYLLFGLNSLMCLLGFEINFY